MAWGPGRYDPRHHAFDGMNLIPLHTPSLPIMIPSIYGLRGVGFETYTGDGPISYWNSYVGVGQMGGHGTFVDPRIGLVIKQFPDRVTPKLDDTARLSIEPAKLRSRRAAASIEPRRSEDGACSATRRGVRRVIRARRFTDVLSGPNRRVPLLHDPNEVGTEPEYARGSATGKYRTTPLRGLWQHAPYFHDGSAPDLPAVVEHYDQQFGLNLSTRQKADLVEYLKYALMSRSIPVRCLPGMTRPRRLARRCGAADSAAPRVDLCAASAGLLHATGSGDRWPEHGGCGTSPAHLPSTSDLRGWPPYRDDRDRLRSARRLPTIGDLGATRQRDESPLVSRLAARLSPRLGCRAPRSGRHLGGRCDRGTAAVRRAPPVSWAGEMRFSGTRMDTGRGARSAGTVGR